GAAKKQPGRQDACSLDAAGTSALSSREVDPKAGPARRRSRPTPNWVRLVRRVQWFEAAVVAVVRATALSEPRQTPRPTRTGPGHGRPPSDMHRPSMSAGPARGPRVFQARPGAAR